MKNYEEIKNYLLNHVHEIDNMRSMISEINSIDGSLEYLEYWDNDEEFFDTFFHNDPMEAVRSSYYGDYNYCDDYVRFNGYANLESANEYDLVKRYEGYIDDIVKALIEHYQEMSIYDDNLLTMVKGYFEE